MNWRDAVDFGELIRRFDRGDRGPVLMALLNRAAFDCFHAPWETLPHPKPRKTRETSEPNPEQARPHLDQFEREVYTLQAPTGRLPLEDEDENEDEDLQIPKLEPNLGRRIEETLSPLPAGAAAPQESQTEANGPLARLEAALEALGLWGHLHQGSSLIVDLPYDPKADNLSQLAFRVDKDQQRFLVLGRSDLGTAHLSENRLEGICLACNRRNNSLEAKTYRPVKGARPRLRMATTLPLDLTRTHVVTVNDLAALVLKSRQFWRRVRRHLSTEDS